MVLYLRCCIANKVLLGAYCVITICCIRLALSLLGYIPLSEQQSDTCNGWLTIGITLAALTQFGDETMASCKRTLEQIEKQGFDERIEHIRYTTYCRRAGHRLAIKMWKERQKRPRS